MQKTKSFVLPCVALMLVVSLVDKVFGEDPTNTVRELLANDLTRLSRRAQEYYRKPTDEHGGGFSFLGLTADRVGMEKLSFPSPFRSNSNGCYIVQIAGTVTSVGLSGIATLKGTDGNNLEVVALVFPDSVYLQYRN